MQRDRGLLEDIERSCERIINRTSGRSFEEFLSTEDFHDSIFRHIAIIGEAARLLSDDAKERLSEVPWHKIVGMRNRLVHEYKAIDFDAIWIAATQDIPFLYSVVCRDIGHNP